MEPCRAPLGAPFPNRTDPADAPRGGISHAALVPRGRTGTPLVRPGPAAASGMRPPRIGARRDRPGERRGRPWPAIVQWPPASPLACFKPYGRVPHPPSPPSRPNNGCPPPSAAQDQGGRAVPGGTSPSSWSRHRRQHRMPSPRLSAIAPEHRIAPFLIRRLKEPETTGQLAVRLPGERTAGERPPRRVSTVRRPRIDPPCRAAARARVDPRPKRRVRPRSRQQRDDAGAVRGPEGSQFPSRERRSPASSSMDAHGLLRDGRSRSAANARRRPGGTEWNVSPNQGP